jgi:hypothetical protein
MYDAVHLLQKSPFLLFLTSETSLKVKVSSVNHFYDGSIGHYNTRKTDGISTTIKRIAEQKLMDWGEL